MDQNNRKNETICSVVNWERPVRSN